jgi:nucleoside-diphosphate-sugar epimerase
VTTRRALVTGGTGVIGPAVVNTLLERGYGVRVLTRRAPPLGLFPDAVTVTQGDITDESSVRAAVAGVDLVLHLAAKLHINNPNPGLRSDYTRVNVHGARLIADAAAQSDVQRLVFFSTIAVYGQTRPGEVLDESSPARAESLYAESKRQAEAMMLAARRSDGEPLAVVLRVAGTYGPRIRGNYRQLAQWLRQGWFVPVGPGENRRTLVHHRDVGAAALLAAEHPDAAGRIFNVTDGAIHQFREIVAAIAGAMHRHPPRYHVPEGPARLGATVFDKLLTMSGHSAVAGPLLDKMLEDLAVSGQRIQDVLGFRPRFDIDAGWAETIPQLFRQRRPAA